MRVAILDATGTPPRARDCVIPAPRRPARPACLTDFLEATPDLIDGMLPHSRRSIGYLNKLVNARPQIAPSTTTRSRKLYSPVGGAVDKGTLYLSGFEIAHQTAERLAQRGARGRTIARMLTAYRPARTRILRDQATLGWLYLLATLDPVLRRFVTLEDVALPTLLPRVSHELVEEWLTSLIPEDVTSEIADLLRAVRDMRLPGPVIANPIFGRLGLVDGSDGDWIAGDTLVEMKCTTGGVQRI
jgi:hypothetical protein